jgi:hypothetical protein
MKQKLIGIAIALFVAIAITGFFDQADAENKVLPLWGNDYGKWCIWHSDTNGSGNEIVHADDYHWDTIAQANYSRSDGQTSRAITFNPWLYDGGKLYLKVTAASAGCSTRVHILMGTDDSTYIAIKDSVAGELEKIYDLTAYYDTDSLIFMDHMDVRVVVGDTITNDTAEFDRKCMVSGRLFGKD